MQKDSGILHDITKLATGAAGSLLDMKREIEAMVSNQLEKLLLKMNLVTKEEFEVVREMAIKARSEQEILLKRVEELEKKIKG